MQNRLTQVKTKEPVLNFLVEQLGIYAENAPNASDYTEVIEFLVGRADEYLNLSDEDLLGNL